MKFDNRPPINLESAVKLASVSRDGGSYHGIGHNRYVVYQGKRVHLIHSYSSGCDYGSGTDYTCTHMGLFQSVEDLTAFLGKQTREDDSGFPWWCSELLEQLASEEEA